MLRRDFMAGQSALLATTYAADADAGPPRPPRHAAAGPDEPALKAASACVAAGQVCLQHCLGLLAAGDADLAECVRAVADMLAISAATQALAATGAPELKAQAAVARDAAARCEAACRRFAAQHPACRECAERCAHARGEYRRLAS
jgi:Cys-rich four helix bundle protein (predicted Tat secretion target)